MITSQIKLGDDRIFYGRLFFGFVFLTWVWRYYNHVLLHQLVVPVYYLKGLDVGYDVLTATGLPDLITGNLYAAIFFDITLMLLILLLFWKPQSWPLAILFSFGYYFYIAGYNSYTLKINHSQIGILWMSFPFWAKKNCNVNLLWQGVRYVIILSYFQAFCYKLFNGTFLSQYQAEAVVEVAAGYSLNSTGATSVLSYLVTYFLSHPFILNAGYSFIILLEGLMMLGLFTKKFDRYLLWVPLAVHISSFIFMSLAFFEMMIVGLLFYHRNRDIDIKK